MRLYLSRVAGVRQEVGEFLQQVAVRPEQDRHLPYHISTQDPQLSTFFVADRIALEWHVALQIYLL